MTDTTNQIIDQLIADPAAVPPPPGRKELIPALS
jgi:hypothetical protein